MKRLLRSLLTFFLMIAISAVIVITRPWDSLPPEWNPWGPLTIEQAMTPITRMKLSRLNNEPEACLEVLATAPDSTEYLALEDYTPVESCPLTNVVRVQNTGVKFNSTFTMTCPLLVRWLMFEEQQLQPLALQHLGSRLESVDHYGTFACRNVYNREQGRRSKHASAAAFDVATFHFQNGAAANVLSDWNNDDVPDSNAFLRDVHDNACEYFGTVLGPDYNAPHANHFHLDNSRFNLCR